VKGQWYSSPRYLEFVAAIHSGDLIALTVRLERALAETHGAELAFWLGIRASRRIRVVSPMMDLAWDDLDEAMRLAPEDEEVQRGVLVNGLAVWLMTERSDRLRPLLTALRPHLWRLLRDPLIRTNLAALHMRSMRWATAYRAFTGALTRLHRMPPDVVRRRWGGFVPPLYARRAVTAIACGRMADAAADVATADSLAGPANASGSSAVVLTLARAELALARGRIQDARSELQREMPRRSDRPPVALDLRVEAELLAARLARAENNTGAFQHFCGRALALLEPQDLPVTRRHIQAVIDGAPY